MANLFISFAFLVLMVTPIPIHPGQANVTFLEPDVTYQFGQKVTFSIQIESTEPITQVYLLLEVNGQEEQRIEIPISTGDKQIRYMYDAADNPLRPFASIRYRFQAITSEGVGVFSAPYFFLYEDNRYDWNMLEKDGITVHWQSQGEDLGQTILTIAAKGLASAGQNFPDNLNPDLINIYAYANTAELQSALGNHKPAWVGGHTIAEYGVILVVVQANTDPLPALERDLPHELAHLLEYELLGEDIDHVPTWLLEGIATLSELNPNPEYQVSLNQAREDGTLYPISSLCHGFPQESSAAFLSYAQSYSFTQYLRGKYGVSGLKDLMIVYSDGVGCEEGTKAIFETPLTKLDSEWKQEELGVFIEKQAFVNLSPYFLILAGFILLLITSLIPVFLKNS